MRRRCPLALVLFAAGVLSVALLSALNPLREAHAMAAQDRKRQEEHRFSFLHGLSTTSNVRIKDISLEPVLQKPLPFVLGLRSRLTVRYETGEVSLTDSQKKETAWKGPVAQAQFMLETVAAIHTLRDGAGQTIWSDAQEMPVPDLRLMKTADGATQLLDRSGSILWSGQLQPSVPEQRTTMWRRGADYHLHAAGVLISGTQGEFTVTNSANQDLLWSGSLPKYPVLLVRDTNQFVFMPVDVSGSESGFDKITSVGYEAQTGTVTITNLQGETIGTRPIEFLKVSVASRRTGQAQGKQQPLDEYPQPCILPKVSLKKDGAVLAVFKDSKGRVLYSFQIARYGDWNRGMG